MAFAEDLTSQKFNFPEQEKSQGIGDFVRHQVGVYLAAHQKDDVLPKNLYSHVMKDVESALIKEVLMFVKGNQSRASQLLGLHRNTLRQKIALIKNKKGS